MRICKSTKKTSASLKTKRKKTSLPIDGLQEVMTLYTKKIEGRVEERRNGVESNLQKDKIKLQ